MDAVRTRFQNRIDVPAAVAPLAGVIERRLHLEFLNNVRVRQRSIREFRDVVIGDADPFDQIVVVVFALAVHLYAYLPPPQLRRRIQFTLRSRRQRQQLLEILRRQRQRPDRRALNRLPRRRIASIDSLHLCLHFNLLLYRLGR